MQIPLQITFRGMHPMPGAGSLIQEQAGRFERFSERIVQCHVTVDVPHRHQRTRREYRVHLNIKTPLGSVIVSRDPPPMPGPRQLDVAIREAFDAALRQLEGDAHRRRCA